jgi:NADH-quinone oxidoreductase subunit M
MFIGITPYLVMLNNWMYMILFITIVIKMLILPSLLTLLTIFILMFIPATRSKYLKVYSLAAAAIIFVATLVFLKLPVTLAISTANSTTTMYLFPGAALQYSYMVDNLSSAFIVLSSLLTIPCVMVASSLRYRTKYAYMLLFIVEFLLFNCFMTTDILFFYLFFEAILIPIYIMIGIWGSQMKKIFAANQFVLYTLFGSFFMLVGITGLYLLTGNTEIYAVRGQELSVITERILFLLFFISFLVKIPTYPLHLWLPKAHVEAPTIGSMLLAGILLKLGSYGYIRFLLFMFPNACTHFLPLIASLAMLSVIMGSILVFRQTDLKRIVAYASIAHMNFLVSAIFVKNIVAMTGALLLQIAHGLSSSALFLLVGVLYDRYGSRSIYYYRGLQVIMPWFAFFFFIFSLANLGFPGTINFVSEMLTFLGTFAALPTLGLYLLIGVICSAIYSLSVATRILYGPATIYVRAFYDLTRREVYLTVPLAFFVIFLGICPSVLTSLWSYHGEVWMVIAH